MSKLNREEVLREVIRATLAMMTDARRVEWDVFLSSRPSAKTIIEEASLLMQFQQELGP